MNGNDLGALFSRLKTQESGAGEQETIAAEPVPWSPGCHLGRDTAGRAVLLIETPAAVKRPGIRLDNLSVEHGRAWTVIEGGKTLGSGYYTVIRCLDRDLTDQFLHVGGVLSDATDDVRDGGLEHLVTRLVSLFRAMRSRSSKSVEGLWGELLVIDCASDPSIMVQAWHDTPRARHDFVLGRSRLEVKTCTGPERRHRFALEQLQPADGVTDIVVSIVAEPVREGATATVQELAESVAEKLDDVALREKILEVVAVTLGDRVEEANEQAYNVERGRASIRFFDAASIPRVQLPDAGEISDVHFSVRLPEDGGLRVGTLAERGPLFRALVPDLGRKQSS